MPEPLDTTMMIAVHDALRRELDRLARVAARAGDDPRQVLRTAAGWRLFTTYLHAHHTAEDTALWPATAARLAGRPDELALLAALEHEHAAVDSLVSAIDAELAGPAAPAGRLGDLIDALGVELRAHLRHEEADGLPLIAATLTEQDWAGFSAAHRERIGDDVPRYLPWLLDGAGDPAADRVLSRVPAPARAAYQAEWRDAYAALDLYAGKDA
ncbi:hypothetical protein Sru01_29420 [Sphaerisporangium rufum]|uniref:Hemerythrin-like domain-containing protein n=1 Tax=Sphaerisporangium rufum TaxID=1381558 RepID=A0A919R682_9ACTN|nr:hemerythrin domain-containing protein [Sphaerisporangium rufum]GII77960.1 hypothetical protein Sru01_29420 [Sphaerisporangium rufum]